MRHVILTLMMLVLFGLLALTCWKFKRWFNYSFDYQDQVQSTVVEMVKPECLRTK